MVKYDLALLLKLLVLKGWFTNDQLNRSIHNFCYKLCDATNKPPLQNISHFKSKYPILKGQAAEIWCFVRLLPILIKDFVEDASDKVWTTILLLRKILEMVCATNLHTSDVAYLGFIIDEYLELRHSLFPNIKLRPKHHFLRHYPSLTLQFGPLISVWAMRFESKHSYFKQCARLCKNFKCICYTLSNKHQLLQAYMLSSNTFFPPSLQISGHIQPFFRSAFSGDIVTAMEKRHLDFSETSVCRKIIYKGTTYNTGSFLLTGIQCDKDETCHYQFGELILIVLVSESIPYFILKLTSCEHISKLDCYGISRSQHISSKKYKCLKCNELLDYYPLPAYATVDKYLLPLRHHVSFAHVGS